MSMDWIPIDQERPPLGEHVLLRYVARHRGHCQCRVSWDQVGYIVARRRLTGDYEWWDHKRRNLGMALCSICEPITHWMKIEKVDEQPS